MSQEQGFNTVTKEVTLQLLSESLSPLLLCGFHA